MTMLKNFDEFNNKTKKVIKEAVAKINDEFKVKTVQSVPVSLIKEYIEKIKSEAGKNPLEFWSAADIAEEMVTYILKQYLKIDNLPAQIVLGDSKTMDETESDAENEVEVETSDSNQDDFTKDSKEEVEVEEEESYGLSDITDQDLNRPKDLNYPPNA